MLSGLFPSFSTYLWSPTSDGMPYVTAATALHYTPVYRAVTLIAGDIARIECEIDAAGADSLWRNPSPHMTAFDLRRSMLMSALLYGNGICAINRTVGGELLELIPLAPDSVMLQIVGGRPVYKTAEYGDLMPDQVLHLKAPGISGLWGDSPVALCRTSIQLLAAQETMAIKAYTNAGNPKIAIVSPKQLSEELMQKVEDYYMKRHGGSANAGRPVVLGDGVRIERISSTIDDTGLEAARAYSIADVCRIYGVPASYLSEDVGSTYGTQEWLSRMYVDACLSPWIAALTAEITTKLGGIGSSMSWDIDDLVRPGMAERMAALRTGVEAGIMTRNEAREELDLAPLPGLDEPIVAKNMGTGGGQTNIGDDTSAGEGTPNDFTT